MKKRIFDRILSVVGIILALAFAAVLIATIFGGIQYEEFDNSLVKWLFVAMSIMYLIIAVLTLINLFSDGDIVKEIALNRDRTGSTKATAAVIKNLARKYIKAIEGVKCTKITLILTEYGVNLRINVRIRDLEIKETTTFIKKLLDDVFDTTLDYKFHSIDFKVQALKSNYEPPKEKLHAETEKELIQEKNVKLAKEMQIAKEEEIAKKVAEATKDAQDIASDKDDIIIDAEPIQEIIEDVKIDNTIDAETIENEVSDIANAKDE
ncbi:MAG TPA: hypothetical protein VJ903_05700 [Clostridia bacterium]|nr:hypothetical protein [Clostridia bacterium]